MKRMTLVFIASLSFAMFQANVALATGERRHHECDDDHIAAIFRHAREQHRERVGKRP
jgi:hypothetical protein